MSMSVTALLEIIETLATYSQWRDGCPDCGSETGVVDRGNGHLWCHATQSWNGYGSPTSHCGRQWQRGEA